MASPAPLRLLIGAALLAAALVAASAAGLPLIVAAMLLLGGAAAALALSPRLSLGGRAKALGEVPQPQPPGRGLVEALSEPALLVDDGRVTLANRAARAVMGEWIEGQDVRLVLRHPAAVERLTGSLAEEEPAEQAEIVGIGEPDRRWTMSVAALGDGTRFVRLSDRSEAHAAEQMRTDFVANASHELRTPLATLVGYSETLLEQAADDGETRQRFLGIIHDEARRMQRLTDDLLSLSRIEAERFTAPRDALALLALVEEARSNCRYLAEERKSAIEIAAPADLPPVAGDRMQLLQLLDNLIANALRYGRPGAPVGISLAPEGDMVRLTVADQGEGIAPEHIPRITQRFYRVDPSRSRSLGGTGLGLSIVKHIVERHRGRLSIESEPGSGTSVHVLLPIASGPLS